MLEKRKDFSPGNPSNSEVSESLLRTLAKSPIAIDILQTASEQDSTNADFHHFLVPYSTLQPEFGFSDLVRSIERYTVCIRTTTALSFLTAAFTLFCNYIRSADKSRE